ncbi:zinc finger protein 385C-like isoform X3 [Onychostruthus taczanowskii]|uniref:zinc finger protein 385C-like isoform X3 n=1 Tax=Onychostruthus taczanowskii TaxID=356909 RepID=UPI001B805C78|nr:zinc finger protein 385C-like isoform X3 [Onychostruthus taczanowskii]
MLQTAAEPGGWAGDAALDVPGPTRQRCQWPPLVVTGKQQSRTPASWFLWMHEATPEPIPEPRERSAAGGGGQLPPQPARAAHEEGEEAAVVHTLRGLQYPAQLRCPGADPLQRQVPPEAPQAAKQGEDASSPRSLRTQQPPLSVVAHPWPASSSSLGHQALSDLQAQRDITAQPLPQLQHGESPGRMGMDCWIPPLLQQSLLCMAPLLEAYQMDPVQKAVISHTFGMPAPLKKKQFISCNICHLRFNSANQAEAHYKGHKHARRLKAIEAMKNKQKVVGAAAGTPGQDSTADLAPSPVGSGELGSTADASSPQESEGEGSSLGLVPSTEESPVELPGTVAPLGSPPASELSEGTSDATSVASSSAQAAEAQAAESGSSVSSAPESEKEGKKSKQHLYCPTCKVTVNSLSQLEAHNTGAKHKSMLEGHGTQLRRGRGKLLSRAGHKSKRIGNKGSINIQNKAFHCQVCEIYVNSETQLKQHMSSRRHKDRLAGKPPKPKYSPYNKLQKNAALAVSILKSKLALQKHLTKTLATRFLPSPLTAAAVCAMPGPLALRPAAATTLFQAPILGPALFRTPPAHVRPTPGPIVFAPY